MNQKELQAYVDEVIRKNGGKPLPLEEMNRHIGKFIEQQNNHPIADFEGFSPNEMSHLRLKPFSAKSPVQFMQLPENEYENIPILRQAKCLLNAIGSTSGLKLTERGNLPTKIAKEMFLLGAGEYFFEHNHRSVIREDDSTSVITARELLNLAGIVKKLHGKLQLTIKGKKIVGDNHKLLIELLTTYCERFDWSSFDGYDLPEIGADGWAFTFVLLGKYGDKQESAEFYAAKYFKAFPIMLEGIIGFDESHKRHYGSVEGYCTLPYCSRTFTHFLKPFGLVTLENESYMVRDVKIKKTPLFDKFIKITHSGNIVPA